ncbi:bifunctional sugar-1-phosphate nucleotidylyltransferase/acetyltransferase [Chloroflexota bacterium]
MTYRIEQAVILAAGEGQRLRPFTALKPKVMIHIAGKPILQYVIEALAQNGVDDILIIVGYRKEHVLDYFGSGERFGVKIEYIEQPQQLGTAHALKHARGMVRGNFLVLSGDNIIEPDIIPQLMPLKPTVVLTKRQENVSKYGVITVRDGRVEEIVEKPKETPSNLVNTGIYVMAPEIFPFVEREVDLTSALSRMISEGHPLVALETSCDWLDVVYPWDILKLNDSALSKISPGLVGTRESGVTIKGPVSVGRGTVIRANSYIVGPAIIGENCEIGPSVYISPATSIGDNTIVSPFSQIQGSVIASDVEIGSGCVIQDSIIDRGCVIKGNLMAHSDEAVVEVEYEYHKVRMGVMVGEHCQIEDNVIIRPGVMIGNLCRIRGLKVIGENIPDGSLVM